MAKSNAFTKFIGPKGTTKDESFLVNQSSPAWVLTFVRWDVRDTLRATINLKDQKYILQTREPLVVENDCIQCSVTQNKGVLTHNMTATLVETDVNYLTSIAPGDFVLVNMLNWEVKARRIVDIARSKKLGPINGVRDGFKGIFKIQSVRKRISVDPSTGVKRVFITVNGFAFTEFNNVIYYNPHLQRDNQGTDKDSLLFPTNLGSDYAQLINASGKIPCQNIIRALIKAFVGSGVSDRGETQLQNGSPITANTHFYMPKQVGTLLGVSSVKAAKDIYNYIFGIQLYAGGSSKHQTLQQGMNPSNLRPPSDRFYYTDTDCPGQTLLKAEYWNQQNAWSILNQYTNAPLNELYTCFRVSPSGRVMPTIVFRQIPFTSDLFGQDPFRDTAKVTKFLSLPRWKVASTLITSVDLGREEAARINFVQYYSTPPSDVGKPQAYLSAQTAARNFIYDISDVQRSGLRPYVVNTSFEDYTITQSASLARTWALILGDALVGGHLKMNGTIETVGIVDPICVGDNFEYDGAVYHIEEISHVCAIDPQAGGKTFRTVLKLSHGVSVSDPRSGLAYPEMEHSRGYNDRANNFSFGSQSLPGISEEQDVSYRTKHPSPAPTAKEVNQKDRPYSQPGQLVKPIKNDRDDDSGGEDDE